MEQCRNTSLEDDMLLSQIPTVKPLITNTSKEFIKCRLDIFSMSFILFYVNFIICENKSIDTNMREQF